MRKLAAVAILLAACALAAGPQSDRWRSVADKLITTPVESYPFDWGEGVQMIGLMKVYERTKDARYADYMEKWTARWTPKDLDELLNIGAKAKGPRPGYCGYWSPGTAFLYLYQARPKPEYLRLAEGINAFVLKGAERSADEGALGHWQGSHQLWVDTLYMACPLLTGFGKLKNQPAWIDDSAQQILAYGKHLQDEKTGLYYHMWDWKTGERSPSLWGRGNGWVLMSIADTMDGMSPRHKHYAALKAMSLRMAAGLKATQDESGMWHTVLDDPASYPECSASSMVVYSVLKLIRLGVLPKEYGAMARKAWATINDRYVRDGIVTGVSAGTDPGSGSHYKGKAVGTQPWGTGAYLMAGSEVHRAGAAPRR